MLNSRVLCVALGLILASGLQAQSLSVAGVDAALGASRARIVPALAATGKQLLFNRDSNVVMVMNAERHSALLQFDRSSGALFWVTKTYSELEVPVAERPAFRLSVWAEFQNAHSVRNCTGEMVPETIAGANASIMVVACGSHEFKYRSLVKDSRESTDYSLTIKR